MKELEWTDDSARNLQREAFDQGLMLKSRVENDGAPRYMHDMSKGICFIYEHLPWDTMTREEQAQVYTVFVWVTHMANSSLYPNGLFGKSF